MNRRFRAAIFAAAAVSAVAWCGCNPVNEEGIADTKSAPIDPNAPVYKTYGEAMIAKGEAEAKARAAAKGKTAKPIPAAPPKETAPAAEAPKDAPKEAPKAQ